MIDVIKALFKRDLERLKKEIESYTKETNLWVVEKEITNSAGNLCLHLIGNLNTYIGKEIGKTDYIRDRDLEFSLKNMPRAELLKKLEEIEIIVNNSLDLLPIDELSKEFPLLVFDKPTSTGYLLIHLTTHLTYHLGQINYHRRLLDIP